ncbi:hypothetical protein NC651_039500 [Populus alba x Populus x berolinensis]|nr:hypothetical protein NC651_039500 [Populus alba x Populus x berolinensis]
MASSSSTNCWKHDVFLNFRGQDTRNTFTSHLHQALCNKGVHVYIDDELERGKAIAPALLQAIEQSRISIAVFSETYACSSYCLDELVKMLECKESKGQVVLPVFYNVDPSDVEAQNDSFGEPVLCAASMAAASVDKLLEWKEALTKAARLSGWHLDNGNEAKTIQSIVEKVLAILNRAFLQVADHPVGLDSHIQDLNCQLRLASNDVFMVGILGIGGIGKTTVAKAIYNEIANQFEGSSFLANVREMAKQNKVVELQQTLLSQILGDKNRSVGNKDFGISVIKDRLCSKKVLVVVDDVDNLDQLKSLAGEPDWFGAGSRIIITSRDEHVLVSHGVKFVHRVQELCRGDAFQLFSWHAFRNSQPKEEFMMHSSEAVTYAQGLPLALVVLGSFLYGRSVHEWESQIDKLKQIPDKKIYEILKISYDGLEDDTQKAIFLDIACFFRGMDKDYVMKVFHACDFKPIIGVQVLIEKSLISIENNKLQMHDLIQVMGRQIVQQESPNIPGRRSRLWFHEDIVHVLTENMGTDEIEAIMLDFHEPEEMHLSAKAFKKMKRLRILIIRNALLTVAPVYLSNELRWLEWPGCPLLSLPSTFHPNSVFSFIT